MPNTKYLLTLILCLATQFGWAQDDKPYFEGEIYRIQMSSGIGSEYKGKHELRTIYKNGNKHIIDVRLGRHTIQLSDQNRCIVYYEGQTEAAEYPLDKLYNMGHTDGAFGIEKKFKFSKSEETTEILGYACEIYDGEANITQDFKTNKLQKNTVNAIRFAVCPNWKTDSIWQRQNSQYPVDGIVMKMVSDSKTTGKSGFSKLHGNLYTSEKVKEVTEREVDDKEFDVPEGIEIKKFRTYFSATTLLNKLAAENKKVLKKAKRYPTQLPDNDTYDTDDEWED